MSNGVTWEDEEVEFYDEEVEWWPKEEEPVTTLGGEILTVASKITPVLVISSRIRI